ncbi:hypothetical protein SAMN05216388_1009127 [Halorientalis persicus]|uniref:HTH iclR-type domain-containing protein n=1 Tax=Halorientalis persicus TaxID=1367881 RepID=A0A1H8MU59_9EURY|nr:helix-turn-helix domain-containing protein [Halorientalis persicus]SEO20897.1 hypothetical protein SAMN05216388_1009127 [Halorientalis persicus]
MRGDGPDRRDHLRCRRGAETPGRARASALAADLGVAKSTANRHLSTPLYLEYVTREDDVIHVELRFLDLGQQRKFDVSH